MTTPRFRTPQSPTSSAKRNISSARMNITVYFGYNVELNYNAGHLIWMHTGALGRCAWNVNAVVKCKKQKWPPFIPSSLTCQLFQNQRWWLVQHVPIKPLSLSLTSLSAAVKRCQSLVQALMRRDEMMNVYRSAIAVSVRETKRGFWSITRISVIHMKVIDLWGCCGEGTLWVIDH